MRELGEGTCDTTMTAIGWDLSSRVPGIVPAGMQAHNVPLADEKPARREAPLSNRRGVSQAAMTPCTRCTRCRRIKSCDFDFLQRGGAHAGPDEDTAREAGFTYSTGSLSSE